MKPFVLLRLLSGPALVAVSWSSVIASGASPDPQELMSQYVAAINAGNAAAALELFADDASISIDEQGAALRCPPPGACFDTTTIQSFLQQQVSEGQQLTVIRTGTSGDGIVASARVSLVSRRTASAGVDRVIVQVLVGEWEGTIAKMTVRPDLTDPETAAFFARASESPMQPPKAGNGGLVASR